MDYTGCVIKQIRVGADHYILYVVLICRHIMWKSIRNTRNERLEYLEIRYLNYLSKYPKWYLVLAINILTHISLFHMVEQIDVKFWGKTMPLGYHLPPDYYRAVPTSITACTVLLVWITLPVLSYNPDLMDPILSDYYEAWADWAKSNILKMFNFMLWVSFYQFNFYENVA